MAEYPVKNAIKNGFFSKWPGLTYYLVSKFLPETSKETAVGHLHCRQQGITSTRVLLVEQLNTVEMMEPELPGQGSLSPNCQQNRSVSSRTQ